MSTNPTVINGDEDEEFAEFVVLHAVALQSCGIPQIYWRSLHHKIVNEVCLLLLTDLLMVVCHIATRLVVRVQ